MNTLRNRVQLIGHLGADPELKTTQNEKAFAIIRLATTDRFQRNGEWKEDTQWHRLIVWERLAERAMDQLQKGSFIALEGKITYSNFEDAKGVMKYSTEIRVLNFISLDKKPIGDPDD